MIILVFLTSCATGRTVITLFTLKILILALCTLKHTFAIIIQKSIMFAFNTVI